MKTVKQLYINNFFFYALMGVIVLFCLAFMFPALYNASWYVLLVLIAFFGLDFIILFASKTGIEAQRITPEKLSNGDENPIVVTIKNYYTFTVFAKVIDEIPPQFQIRNFNIKRKIKNASTDDFQYFLRPTERGEYHFGRLNIYISSPLQLLSRRYIFSQDEMVPPILRTSNCANTT